MRTLDMEMVGGTEHGRVSPDQDVRLIGPALHPVDEARWPEQVMLHAVASGAVEYRIGRRHLVLDPDNFLLTDGEQPCSSRALLPGTRMLVMVFPVPALRRAMASVARLPGRQPAVCTHLHPRSGHVGALLEDLFRDERTADGWGGRAAHTLLNCLASPGSELIHDAQSRTHEDELLRRLRLARDLIESFYQRPIGLADFAAAACLSRFHFLREFKREFGMTPGHYLTRKRVKVAQRLLLDRRARVSHVAEQVGFESRSSLVRSFNRFVGCSPRVWRQRAGNPRNMRSGNGSGDHQRHTSSIPGAPSL